MNQRLPRHIGIIMDGNGRWAQSRRLPRIEGHRVGSKNVRKIGTHASNLGVEILTLYAFSKENWARPRAEVELLMALLRIYAIRERAVLMKNNIRMRVIGDLSGFPVAAQKELLATIELTKKNSGMILQLALGYGGRADLVQAMRQIAKEVQSGDLKSEEISEDLVSKYLWTSGQPDPDLIIRTSGEFRTSNFLTWQSAYSELYFTEKAWPEFTTEDLDLALQAYQERERRFGALQAPVEAKGRAV